MKIHKKHFRIKLCYSQWIAFVLVNLNKNNDVKDLKLGRYFLAKTIIKN